MSNYKFVTSLKQKVVLFFSAAYAIKGVEFNNEPCSFCCVFLIDQGVKFNIFIYFNNIKFILKFSNVTYIV